MEDEQTQPRIAFARDQARKILKELKIKSPPILLSQVIYHLKKTHDIKITARNLGGRISGIQAMEGVTSFITYNITQHQHRQRFTLAHELGHIVLGHTSPNNFDYGKDTKNPYDIEANNFAAELLMPLYMIKEDRKKTPGPDILARKYIVSPEAMWRRLLECKLI